MASSAIKTPAFLAKAGNIQNEDGSSIYSNGDWSLKNSSAVASVTITDDGKVGVGTASPASKIHIQQTSVGTYFSGNASDATRPLTITSSTTSNNGDTHTLNASSLTGVLGFATAGTERMRINANGAVTVGPNATSRHEIASSPGAGTQVLKIRNATSGATRTIVEYQTGTSTSGYIGSNTSYPFYVLNSGGGEMIKWASGLSGTLSISNGLISGSSDARLKIEQSLDESGLSLVNDIKVKKYKWKDTDLRGDEAHLGFFAQEMTHIPGAVGAPDDEGYLGLFDRPILAACVKAIQEQQAQIEELKAKVSALEAK